MSATVLVWHLFVAAIQKLTRKCSKCIAVVLAIADQEPRPPHGHGVFPNLNDPFNMKVALKS
jgi:hypothetical protein